MTQASRKRLHEEKGGHTTFSLAARNRLRRGKRCVSPFSGDTAAVTASPSYERIWQTVQLIPEGHVATYGQIAELAGLPGHARQVGYALHSLPEGSEVPWQRVVNAGGRVSPRAEPGWENFQRILLLEEGVVFGADGRIDFERFGWQDHHTASKSAAARFHFEP